MLFQNRYNQAIKFLNLIVPKKSSLSILSCIRVSQKKESITYEATDLNTFLRIFLPVWGAVEGEYAVDAKILSQVDNKIATKITEKKVEFTNVSVANCDVKEFPSLQTVFFKDPVFESFGIYKKDFVVPGMKASDYAALNDPSREILNGVCFRSGFFYATNGNFLFRQSIGLKSKKKFECVIPASFFRFLNTDFIYDPVIDISVYLQDKENGYIVASGRGFELVSKLLTGEYPDVERILPKEMPYSFSFEREEFLTVAKKALVYAKTTKSQMIDLSPNGKCLTLRNVAVDETTPVFSDTVSYKPKSKKKWAGVSLNAKMLVTILQDCQGRSIEMKASENPISPVTFHPEDESLFFLLMPLRRIDETAEAESEEKSDKESDAKKPDSAEEKKEQEVSQVK